MATKTVLVLRTCAADMTSHGGFAWPTSGPVEAPDWEPTPECGAGLHGLLWGEGDGELLKWSADARWLVVRVPAELVVELDGKVKFRAGVVVYCGDRAGATNYIARHGGAGRAIVGHAATAGPGGTAIAGDRGTATAGFRGSASAGARGSATAGPEGSATAGFRGSASAGPEGTATAGFRGSATAGPGGTAIAGFRGSASAGERGSATAGDRGSATVGAWGIATVGAWGTATAGPGGTLCIHHWTGTRWTLRVGEIKLADGTRGTLDPDTPYRLDTDGQFIVAERT